MIRFARDILKQPLDPWQEWLVIHAGELREDGLPRFRQVLTLVSRQNGKTELLRILALYWLFVDNVPLVLGTSTNLGYALESWQKAVDMAENNPELFPLIRNVRKASGEQSLDLSSGARYRIAASNSRGGRGLTVHRLIMDELREHHDWTAYSAAVPATSAVNDAQIWMISNAGDEKSIVLNSIRSQALEESDPRLGLFEWSAPDGAKATDLEALMQANPNLGRRINLHSLLGEAKRAQEAGGEQLATFLTEYQCRNVPIMDPAVDIMAWRECLEPGEIPETSRRRVALCFDVAEDMQHASLYAAAPVEGGKVRVEPVAAWSGPRCIEEMRRWLLGYIERVKPKVLGWFPSGPAATVAADMAERPGWPPRGMTVEPIRGDVVAVCMGFAEQVRSHQVVHSGDPLLDAHITGAEKLYQGDGWRFTRRGVGHVDAAYAAAGAVHLGRILPPHRPLVVITGTE